MTGAARDQRFLDLLDEVDRARNELERALADLEVLSRETRAWIAQGMRVSAVHPAAGAGPVRREVNNRLTDLNSALMHLRAEAVRVMVDEEGLSLRDVGRLIGNSRQFVSRLYHHAVDDGQESGEDASPAADEPA